MAYYGENEYSLEFSDRDLYYPSQYDLYCKLGEYLTGDEVKLLTYLLGNELDDDVKARIHCGLDLFLAMEERNICNDEIFRRIAKLLKLVHRYDVFQHLHITGKRRVAVDPLEEYIKANELQTGADADHDRQIKRRKTENDVEASSNSYNTESNASRQESVASSNPSSRENESLNSPWQIKEKYTCDVRLRVRAEYCSHDDALRDNIGSNRQHELERKFECFVQANNILKTRDLGYIICDIKFSEITYLDAFWRDYLNGSLLEALKVFKH